MSRLYCNKLIIISVISSVLQISQLCSAQIAPPLAPRDNELEEIVKDVLKSAPSLKNVLSQFEESDFLDQYKLAAENTEEKDLEITQLAAKNGNLLETHHVQTEDGYIIAVYRIPSEGDPVLVVHGLLLSAVDWFTIGNNALPYVLADQGYDVWVLSVRGCTDASRGHVRLTAEKDPAEYYNFSWDEIGRYDLPATIDFVLKCTGKSMLRYIGHSQGNTAFFVMASERPEYNDKITLMVALSPVGYMTHVVSPLARVLSVLGNFAEVIRDFIGLNVLFDENHLIHTLTRLLCGNSEVATLLCGNIEFLLTGFDYGQVNVTQTPVIFGHIPSAISTKQLFHYLQEIQSEKFRRYDNGPIGNKAKYGFTQPPEYLVERIRAPVALFYRRDSDWLSAYEDVLILMKRLPNVVDFYEVPYDQWCHTDYLWAKDVKTFVYDRILELFNKY